MKQLVVVLLSLFLLPTSMAFAHDPSRHKGPKIDGTVRAVESTSMTVETAHGNVLVRLTPETTHSSGNNARVKVGERVTVVGHKLSGGEFAATEVHTNDREPTSANQDAKDALDLGGYDSPIR
jgi:hypothetical protein